MNDLMITPKQEQVKYAHKQVGGKAAIYNNDLNKLNIGSFAPVVQDIFVTIIAACRGGKDISCDNMLLSHYAEITFDDFRKMTGSTERGDKNLVEVMEKFADQMVSLHYKIIVPGKIVGGSLFPLYEIDLENRLLKVAVSPSLSYILNDTDRNFTEFMVEDHNRIHGKYAKTLYRILCQWKGQGKTRWFDITELKGVFGADNYDTKNFIREIKKGMAELAGRKSFRNLLMDFKRDESVKGKPVSGIRFTFSKTQYAPVLGTSEGL